MNSLFGTIIPPSQPKKSNNNFFSQTSQIPSINLNQNNNIDNKKLDVNVSEFGVSENK
jgi:hypothetical protein